MASVLSIKMECPYCSDTVYKEDVITHILTEHEDKIGKEKYIECPFCHSKIKRTKFQQHLVEVHLSKKEKKLERELEGTGPIMMCPYCYIKIRRSNLKKHVDLEHPYRILLEEMGIGRKSNIKTTDLKDQVETFLNRLDYITQTSGNFIIAINNKILKTICIRITNNDEYCEFKDIKSIFLTFKRFKRIILGFQSASKIYYDADHFNKDVIVPFGWNAYRNEAVRRDALVDASMVWGKNHISNLLLWLKNTWPKNPNLNRYSDVVASDYNWYMNNIGRTYENSVDTLYLRRMLIKEFTTTVSGSSMIKTVNEIDNWFILRN